ncbi:hypothetical protein EJB05_49837, partial [Eragrostis curvula]
VGPFASSGSREKKKRRSRLIRCIGKRCTRGRPATRLGSHLKRPTTLPLALAAAASAPLTGPNSRTAQAARSGRSHPLSMRPTVSATSLLLAALPFPALLPQLVPIASATEVPAGVQEGSGGAAELELERYTDQEQGFTLLKPTSWPTVWSTWNELELNFRVDATP